VPETPQPPPIEDAALFTDLYELTMLQAYFNEGMDETAVFDLSIRSLPPERNFLVACGLEQALEYLETLHFSETALAYLDSLGLFTPAFLDCLRSFRFTGRVRAVAEGTIVFAQEPLLEVCAPIMQAQLVETWLLNQVTFGTLIASKGARAVLAAPGKTLVDFGSRRAHGSDAAIKAARALYLAGYDSTSNVLAGQRYGIPVAGTMAHSYILAHDSEREAFRRFLESYPETVLLVDTFDTEEGTRTAVDVVRELGDPRIRGIRLDSGDLAELAKLTRRILDDAGLTSVRIFASGGLDEAEIASLLAAGAPIDAFGVGTSAVVSNDVPAIDSTYKLVSYAGTSRIKLSPGKVNLPGEKQVFRHWEGERMSGDVIALSHEELEGTPLLEVVMEDGQRTVAVRRTLEDARTLVRQQLGGLPDSLRGLDPAPAPYPVTLSRELAAELEHLRGDSGQ
jgi:nicotinate phosphoribosyltransferase